LPFFIENLSKLKKKEKKKI